MGAVSRSPFQDMKMALALMTTDIGGTNATSAYFDIKGYGAITFIIQLGDQAGANWDATATDDLTECYLKQATSTAGASAKAITGAEINTDLDAVGEIGALTVRANALDIANGFDCVGCYVSENGNTAVDYVTIWALLHEAQYHYSGLVNAYKIIG